MEIDVAEWADRWQKVNREYDGSMRDRPKVGIQFSIDLIRAVIAADNESKPEQPAPAPAGDVPDERLRQSLRLAYVRCGAWEAVAKIAESEIARRVAEATAARDAEIERLKAELAANTPGALASARDRIRSLEGELAEAKKRALPAGWKMSETMISRQDECERLAKENATLREQLAEATTPVDLDSANIRELDGMKMIYLGDAQAAVRCERAARLAAERRLALTREAWRHRSIVSIGRKNWPRGENHILTDADIDAAIEAHEKSKADAAGGGE